MQQPQRTRMAHAAVCRLYTLTDGTGAPIANRRAHTTIHMEQQPQRARMARAAVCMLYTLTDGTGAPQRTAGHILPSTWSNTHSAHGWHILPSTWSNTHSAHGWRALRSVCCTPSQMVQEHRSEPQGTYYHPHGATPTAGTDGARNESYKIKINNSLLLFTYFTLLLLIVYSKQIFCAM